MRLFILLRNMFHDSRAQFHLTEDAMPDLSMPTLNARLSVRGRRSEYWPGGGAALLTVMLFMPTIQTGLAALLFLSALVALKEIVWNFLILDLEDHQIGNTTLGAMSAFCMIYLAAVPVLAP
ncbi:hypothetical protein [Roseinatronobacter sp.]|uniref:hypothetical protein n=1 Tax=Roseinatronobacter sp. TaxID=1945755 RepID=UPI003F72383B